MRFMLPLILFVVLVFWSAAPGRAASVRDEISALLTESSRAWNRGDLDAFMKSYEDSSKTVYIGSTAVFAGYAAIRARYAEHYHPGQMGILTVSNLAVRPLGPAYAVAAARWHLARSAANGGDVSGLFSLVLHRRAEGWRIIVDHTP